MKSSDMENNFSSTPSEVVISTIDQQLHWVVFTAGWGLGLLISVVINLSGLRPTLQFSSLLSLSALPTAIVVAISFTFRVWFRVDPTQCVLERRVFGFTWWRRTGESDVLSVEIKTRTRGKVTGPGLYVWFTGMGDQVEVAGGSYRGVDVGDLKQQIESIVARPK
jgi:hypothetical protein